MINAIILAAGKGTRMKTEMPKCIFPILKKPMLSYILSSLDESIVENRIIVVGHKKEMFYEMYEDELFAIQENQLGTADAIKSTLPMLDDGISIILPGDTPLISKDLINDMISFQKSNDYDLVVGTINMDNPFGYGRIVKNNDYISKIVEEKDASSEIKKIREVNSGIMVVKNSILKEYIPKIKNNNAKNEYYLTDLIEIVGNAISYEITDKDSLMGINDLYTLSVVEKKLSIDIKKKLMLDGVNIINPDTVIIGPDVKISSGVTIYPNTFITGNTIILENAIIGPNSELHNAKICENALCRHSVIYDSTISKDAEVGPFTHLRMNAVVGEKGRVGNFVEIKNSTLGYNTKSAHLSYLGDSTIGDKVNIGCGSITVNYDGKKKSRTVIGNNVFVGCNSNLIAPITIADNSFIAAGSTITDDVDENDLAIARARQVNKKGYAKKYK